MLAHTTHFFQIVLASLFAPCNTKRIVCLDHITFKVNKQGLNSEKGNLSTMTREMKNELNKEYPGKHGQIEFSENLTGFGDTRLLHIVLENLFAHAYKHSAPEDQLLTVFGLIEIEGQPV